ncbi:NAD-glutamate dehydrogenase domain-containing protein [Sulfurospirillum arcachonense]|uniref:NAD-glutamate dehydrogenase domain-containing protein n=1 Tax=Sulfurospirillum arcachonense TaxID=57666 RepID=UPI00046AF001|nr:NAD-glutamate dehydrogenase domain-containing protein [Sulfurospirillum arcachonense]
MVSQDLSTACSQILTQDDLIINDDIVKRLSLQDSVIDLFTSPNPIIKIYSKNKLTLTQIIPIFHNFKFDVIDELSYTTMHNNEQIYINKFNIRVDDNKMFLDSKNNILEIISSSIDGKLNFGSRLFELVYKEDFCLRGILLFKALINYEDQLVIAFNNSKITKTIVKFSNISGLFLEYFNLKFEKSVTSRTHKLNNCKERILEEIKKVDNITEDKILKLFFEILKNITRTTFFLDKETIAFKVDTKSIKQYLKGMQPNIEMFVFHQEFNGIHLRMGKVSRGGIRWSDRYEDFRSEIKSLMAAQESKNAVIIPEGAKGGFIIYKHKEELSPEQFEHYYKEFINGLLDLVDNYKNGEIVKNSDIICYDDDDPYFVVAADKGTSSMSDIANSISIQRDFWLKDAFASGGSNGYHHKKLGITARGSLRSSERFFIEKGINFYETPITIVGIGSMNGDVFGNGMIESKQFKLIAAISHNEIFIDPNPDPLVSYEERLKLFSSKNGKWSNYDKKKISKGGGVFKRSEKEIVLSPEIKKLLKTTKKILNAEELAKSLLTLHVDMIYNGGVGTYFKASSESNIEVGDKENEALRLDANEINAFCICEGGNLGLTQKARIEYAQNGGKLNLDSIDNAAGVNTSDHEVNLKVLLNKIVEKGILSEDTKNESLKSLSSYVVDNVLWSNYLQAISISLDELRSREDLLPFKKVIETLEGHLEYFNRFDFEIPKNVDLHKVTRDNGAIIRPILSILTLYSKILLQKLLKKSSMITDDMSFEKFAYKYFPKPFVSAYEDQIKDHPLKKEIVSVILANKIINFYGSTFIADLNKLGEEKFLLKIKAYLISNELFCANDVRFEIYRDDFKTPIKEQYKMLMDIENAIDYNTQWILQSLRENEISFSTILGYKSTIEKVITDMQFHKSCPIDTSSSICKFFSTLDYLKLATAIIHIKKSTDINFIEIAEIFYFIMDKLYIATLLEKIEKVEISNETDQLLKTQLQKIVEMMMILVTKKMIHFKRKNETTENIVNNYLSEKGLDFEYYNEMIEKINKSEETPISSLAVVVNYLLLI